MRKPNTGMLLRRKPHFSIRNGEVFFLNATRSQSSVSPEAQSLFQRLDADQSIEAPNVPEAIAELTKQGLCDLIAPVTASNRRTVLVLEPHSDDAALSIGGVMWQQHREVDFTLVTLASRSNYTSSFQTGRPFFDRDAVSNLRRQEGEIFMDHMGGSYRVLNLPEATLRYADTDWSLDFFKAHRTSVAINNNRRADDSVLECWIKALTPPMTDPSYKEIWLPLGAGTHSDHDLTRNAALHVLMQNAEIIARAKILIYKDVPYGTNFTQHTDRLLHLLRTSGAQVEERPVKITPQLDKKLELLEVFASQFKVAHVRDGVQRSAAVDAPEGHALEHLWQMVKVPQNLDAVELFIESEAAGALKDRLTTWLRGARTARRLRILALAASGSWSKDEAQLRAQFPNATIEVFATPATRQEIAEQKSTDVVLHDVESGSWAWARLALQLAISSPSHILFVAGDRLETAKKLSRLWPLSTTLVVHSFEHVALALGIARDD